MIRSALVLIITVLVSSCGPTDLNQTQGVYWEEFLDYPVSKGLVLYGNRLFFSDDSQSLLSYFVESSSPAWKFKLSNAVISGLYAWESGLYVFLKYTNTGQAVLQKRMLENGVINMETNCVLVPSSELIRDGNYLYYHSASNVLRLSLINDEIITNNTPLSLDPEDRIEALFDLPSPYSDKLIAVTRNCSLIRISKSTLVPDTPVSDIKNNPFYGSGVIAGYRLYLGTSNGLRCYDFQYNQSVNTTIDRPVFKGGIVYDPTEQVIYAAHGSSGSFLTSTYNIGSYIISPSTGALSEKWYQSASFSYYNYSPVVFSYYTGALAAIDESGALHVQDKNTGALKISKFMGSLDRRLRFPMDLTERYFYLAVANPTPKLACYSIDWAMNQASFPPSARSLLTR